MKIITTARTRNIRSSQLVLTFMCSILFVLVSCTPKFNFNNAYKFSTVKPSPNTHNKQVNDVYKNEKKIEDEIAIVASINSKEPVIYHPEILYKPKDSSQPFGEITEPESSTTIKQTSTKEVKTLRNEIMHTVAGNYLGQFCE